MSAETKGEWVDVVDEDESGGVLRQAFETLLTSDTLIVLAGLGTSLGLRPTGGKVPPKMSDLWQAVKDADPELFGRVLQDTHFGPENLNGIELLLSKCQSRMEVGGGVELQNFITSAEGIVADACDFLGPDDNLDTHRNFLRRIVRRPNSKPRTRLFTTNYDLSFEYAASSAGLTVIDGFTFSQPHVFEPGIFDLDLVRRAEQPEYVPGVFHLLKLHGSIDWEATQAGVRRQPHTDSPLLIYPRSSKFQHSYQRPFFDLMANLQHQLRLPNVGLLVVGFGFADDHIVQPLMSAVRDSLSLTSVVASPTFEDAPPHAVEQIIGLAGRGDSRHLVMNGTFDDLTAAMPDLLGETQREAHATRLQEEGFR